MNEAAIVTLSQTDIYAAAEVHAEMMRLLQVEGQVVLDLQGASTLHTSILQSILALARSSPQGQDRLQLVGLSPELEGALTRAGLSEILGMRGGESESL